ncbi:MAG: class I SAM-dependent methyltransferase [Acidimicrobiia bacterium]
MSDWQLDERMHAGDEHLDADYVAGYDRKSGFDPADDIGVLRRHGLTTDSVVVDMGAGTGVFTAAVAPLCHRVIAVDVSPVMTAALRSRVEHDGLDSVRVVEAGFLSYDHDTKPADFLYTRNALHQVPDFWKAIALQRFALILRPGGILRVRDLVFDFDPGDAERSIETWLSGAVTDPTVGFTAEELATHVRTEFSTYSWLFEAMLERVGFTILDRTYRRSAYGTYTCARRAT